KDAAIREVHHRVKNNLQTISSLLALQGRRSPEDSARKALGEAERRVRSIALVHEVLSRDPSDQIPFDSIVGTLIHMAEDSVVGDLEVTISEEGSIGEIGAEVATPLAVIMAELLQNAVEHAFTDLATRAEPRVIKVTLDHDDKTVYVEIRDNGSGLPDDFSIEDTGSLGLSIVRDLVRSQLGGEISMTNGLSSDGGGVQVILEVPRRLED
ncbi:MAG: sensor histidine kinase, partial [Actinomycetes bacterium]